MRILISCLLCLYVSPFISAQHITMRDEMNVDWPNPETRDSGSDEEIGEFLDADLLVIQEKAEEAYQSGEYEKAVEYYLELLHHDIHDASSIYDLACCYGLLGEAELAALFLKKAARAGFYDIEWIRQDPDFEKVRGKEVFDAQVESIALQIAKQEKRLGDIIYTHAPALFQSRVHLPGDYDPKKSYPLVVGLHGRHGTHERFITLWEGFGNPQFVYSSPQAPYPVTVGREMAYDWTRHGWTGREWRSWHVGEKEWMDKDIETTVEHIVRLVQDLSDRYSIDGVYLMGFSQGAILTCITGICRHDLFKGLICFSGALEIDWFPEGYLEAASNLKVFMAHGKHDQEIPYEAGIQARDVLGNLGYDVTFRDFEGGHTIPEEILKEVVTWIKEG
jgi:phospholipase/carboxylesterase